MVLRITDGEGYTSEKINDDHPLEKKYCKTIIKCFNKTRSIIFWRNKNKWNNHFGRLTLYQLATLRAIGKYYPIREESVKEECECLAKGAGAEFHPRFVGLLKAITKMYPQFSDYLTNIEKWKEIGYEELYS
jgi:hypothetical protein